MMNYDPIATEQKELIFQLVDEVQSTTSADKLRELFNQIPLDLFSDHPEPYLFDVRPAFLGNPHTPEDIVDLLEHPVVL